MSVDLEPLQRPRVVLLEVLVAGATDELAQMEKVFLVVK
eukprot:CAMPEP_0175832430 /NCGR_PEP_ID=MMETSP0107_2-20121207/14982_1 /TAXON_ID=195067 ORGANISM="Goniomonas pacifica, Strain CCMP1869" /NCGR_SAMPLE_ID=MMETSP0107_2 /ASSEMBLY_ACC=CAM_ASM_000203 /LENGTH=38 /DNA_ID= /DNA_START= /DNA_END= /DNA_ORIENTATION=